MADEETQEEIIEEEVEETPSDSENKVEKRIKELSKKVKLTSEERDELSEAKQKAEQERDDAKKEVEFYSSFSDTIDKYPAAKEFKDQIKEKVLTGYSMEDAAVAILAKEGKFTPAPQETENPAGGSATNTPGSGESKSLEEMSLEEKRAAVQKAIEKGDISV